MSRTVHDYELLERQYITSEVSIRQLCAQNGITNWSTVSQQAKKREWERKRAAFKEKAFEADITQMAHKRAIKLQQTFEDAIDVIDAAFLKMADDMAKDKIVVTPGDIAKLIDKLQLLTGGVTSREEVRNLNLTADLPPELLRDIQNTARANGAGGRSVGQSPLPVAEGPRQVN